MRCLALFTSGLDSLLAVRLMQEQGIDARAFTLATPLVDDASSVSAAAAKLGVELIVADLGDAYSRFLRQPRFGYVSGAAPCTDCRIAMFAAAREKLIELQFDFVVSGEVVGQRPRTAIRDFEVVAQHAGLADLLVRPLSARLLPATMPETRGWVDRSQLLGFQGKSRRPQHELARQLGLQELPAPRPDCPLLTGPIAAKALDLVRSRQTLHPSDLQLLSIGRHYRLDSRTKVIVGRSREESSRLAAIQSTRNNEVALLEPDNFPGPVAILVGDGEAPWEGEALASRVDFWSEHLASAASLLAARGRIAPGHSGQVRVTIAGQSQCIPVPETASPWQPIGADP